jgi:hypothetical protein
LKISRTIDSKKNKETPMNKHEIKTGLKVRVSSLSSAISLELLEMDLNLDNIKNREKEAEGTVQRWVSGFDGSVWLVKHNNGKIAVYRFNELEPIE